MKDSMKAARLHKIGDFRCDEVPVPVPHGEELLLKVGACGVCGSDLPRVYEHGTSNGVYPLTIGHEFSGTVVQAGEDADPGLVGLRGAVFPLIPCMKCIPCSMGHYAMCEHYDYMGSRRDGGFAEYCLIPSKWHLHVSRKASAEELAMTEPASVAQHAVRRANVTAGQFVVIFGAGAIGIMAARWVRIFGARPLLIDIVPERVAFARETGLDAINSREADVTGEIRERNGGQLADAAIEGTGAGPVLTSCIESVHATGTIALLGNPSGAAGISPDIHSRILRQEITINGVWNSNCAAYPVNEWDYTVRMLDEGRLQVADLISDRLSLEDLPDRVRRMREGQQGMKVMYVAR